MTMKLYRIIFVFLLLYQSFPAIGQVHALPFDSTVFKPLEQVRSVKLEKELKQLIGQEPKWAKLVKQKKMSVGVVDLSDPSNAKYAAVNGKHMMYAASLPKIAILVAVMDAIERGEIELTEDIDHMLHQMIRVSSNSSSTELIDLVGYDKIARTLRDKRYRLYDKNMQGGLWVGKRYGKGGKKNPDPLKGLSHAASAFQVCRFYYMLAYGKLISCERSEQMMEYLLEPHLHHKFVYTFDKIAPNADLYRKSGTWRTYHADSVMIIGDKWRSYILVALINDPGGEKIMRELVLKVDTLLNKSL